MSQTIASRLAPCILVICAGLATVGPTVVSAAPADPSGVWITEDGRGRIRLEHCISRASTLCGYVVWMKAPRDGNGRLYLDTHNPDNATRSRVLLGHQLLFGLKPTDDGRFAGDIYNADDGKTYEVTLWRNATSTITLKGCMLAFFCGSQIWKRSTDIAPGELTKPTGSPDGPRPYP